MQITYDQFKTAVKAIAMPEGEGDNLITAHDNYISNALIHAQTYIPCLQDFHVDYFAAPDVFDACDVAYLTIPRGTLRKVYAFKPDADCKKYEYEPGLPRDVHNYIQTKQASGATSKTDGVDRGSDWCYAYYTSLGTEEDDACWKTEYKFYCRAPGCKLIVAPRFPCGYVLAVQWAGIKRTWADTDTLPDDQDLVDLVALYLEGERALRLDGDRDKHVQIMGPEGDGAGGRYGTKLADMIKRCRAEMRVPRGEDYYDNLVDEAITMYDPVPSQAPPSTTESEFYNLSSSQACSVNTGTEVRFAAVGDTGYDNDYQRQVSDLAKKLSPDFVVLLGDLNYPSGETATIQANLVDYWRPFIPNNAYPAWGNHDLSNSTGDYGAPLMDLFPNIGALNFGKKYYTFTKGPVQFFVVNSGYSAADPREDDGIVCSAPYGTTIQYDWIAAAIAASTAPWKVLCMHRAPYTSETTYNPGVTALRCWSELDVDMVIYGHAHAYERMEVNGVPHLNIGTGGSPLRNFGTPIDESQFRYNSKHGILVVSASQLVMNASFYNVDEQIIDSFRLEA